jgi:hypothetical protein
MNENVLAIFLHPFVGVIFQLVKIFAVSNVEASILTVIARDLYVAKGRSWRTRRKTRIFGMSLVSCLILFMLLGFCDVLIMPFIWEFW